MQLAALGGARLASTADLHAPPRIHAPPTALRVGVAEPREPSQIGGGLRVRSLTIGPDGSTGNATADSALRTASVIDEVLRERFKRSGIDGAGGVVELVVHTPDKRNAYWDREYRRIELGDGDGKQWGPFGASASVMAHEMYHGVIDTEVQLDYEQPEQAAIHESLADVFAAGVVASWRIGEDVVTPGVPGDWIRDLASPKIAHLRDAKAAGGQAHALSGVASLAAVRAAEQLGRDELQVVWYRALVDHLPDAAGFTDLARATVASAGGLYGRDSPQQRAVAQAWESVGVLVA